MVSPWRRVEDRSRQAKARAGHVLAAREPRMRAQSRLEDPTERLRMILAARLSTVGRTPMGSHDSADRRRRRAGRWWLAWGAGPWLELAP